MSDFFYDEAETGSGSEEMLLKALTAGHGTDAAQFAGGRALQPEDCETTLINVMREQKEDFKLMNTLKKTTVGSTVHQFNLRSDFGDEDLGFVEERGVAPDNNQAINRVTRDMKFIQKRGEVSEQLIVANTFENAFEEEKLAATMSVLKTAEKYAFHGDSEVVGTQFDGLLAQVRRAPAGKRNVHDLRGQSIRQAGESVLTQMAEMIADQGGEANRLFYPLILGQDLQDLCRDRLRFGTDDDRMSAVFKAYPTIYGTLAIAGDDAGPDKMFRPKGTVKPGGIPGKAPAKPAIVGFTPAPNSGSLFAASDAGVYRYTVHSVNEHGVSEAAGPFNVTVASGNGVRITITPAEVNPGAGFIICRSAKDGSATMEMARIGRNPSGGNTAYTDLNEDLPGTAEMLFLTEKKMQVVTEFFQLLPMRLYRMFPTDRLVTPFIMALWGAPSLKAPHWCGVVKNIAYRGGL